MAAQLEIRDADTFAVLGDLDFDSVGTLLEEYQRLSRQQQPSRIDLSGVNHSNSGGVALLVEWLRQARIRQQELQFVAVPVQMQDIIRLTDLDELLPLG